VAASSLSGKPPVYLVLNRGILLAQLARYPEALATLDEAIELAKRSDNRVDLIIGNAARADVHVYTGDVTSAARELQELTPLIDETIAPDSSLRHRIVRLRARIDAAAGRVPEAIAGYSDLIAQPAVQKTTLARSLAERADLYLKIGRLDLAFADAQRDVQVARELQRDKPYSSYTGRALAVLARCKQAKAAPAEARTTAAEAALNLAKTLGDDHPDTRWARQAAQLQSAARRVRTSARARDIPSVPLKTG
jgi:tetratricopeptide (TPR) repeat protein